LSVPALVSALVVSVPPVISAVPLLIHAPFKVSVALMMLAPDIVNVPAVSIVPPV
jgi:hypothetical protein